VHKILISLVKYDAQPYNLLYRMLSSGSFVDADMLFQAGSISKSVAALGAIRVVQEM